MPTADGAAHAAFPDAQGFDCHIEVSESASQGTSKSLRGLFYGFAATVTAGLALASWYVGVRIVAADAMSAAAARQPARNSQGDGGLIGPFSRPTKVEHH